MHTKVKAAAAKFCRWPLKAIAMLATAKFHYEMKTQNTKEHTHTYNMINQILSLKESMQYETKYIPIYTFVIYPFTQHFSVSPLCQMIFVLIIIFHNPDLREIQCSNVLATARQCLVCLRLMLFFCEYFATNVKTLLCFALNYNAVV